MGSDCLTGPAGLQWGALLCLRAIHAVHPFGGVSAIVFTRVIIFIACTTGDRVEDDAGRPAFDFCEGTDGTGGGFSGGGARFDDEAGGVDVWGDENGVADGEDRRGFSAMFGIISYARVEFDDAKNK